VVVLVAAYGDPARVAHLDGKSVIVTGGTGALGSAVVRAFLAAGASVEIPFHDEKAFETLRAAVGPSAARLGGARVDLTDEQATTSFTREVTSRRGGLDVLVNVAGAWAGGRPVDETPWEVWQQMLDVNLKTAVLASRAAIPHLVARGGGAIVNVASRAAVESGASAAAYAASKSAVVHLTQALAAELHDRRVRTNVVLPGLIDTPANRAGGMSGGVDPAAIARVILFLCSDDARVISGASVPVYG
jgi:NAD(P)-dependent dehydrogenase (short-subunit alcohol dehydrogenase family)